MPFFSIIIPSYNSGNDLIKSLESIFLQTFHDYEVWIIDGGSTDNTKPIIEALKNENKKIFYISETDAGIYDAMNKGINHAKGEWLLFLGADDELYNHCVLEDVFKTISKGIPAKLIYGDVQIHGYNNWAKDGQIYDGVFDSDKLLMHNICHQSIFYHRTVFEKLGNFNVSYSICADWDFNLKCFSAYTVQYVNIIVAHFSTGGLSSTFSKNDNFLQYDFVDNYARYFKLSIFNRRFKPHFHILLNKSIWCFQNKKFISCFSHLVAAIFQSFKPLYCVKVFIKKTVLK